VRNKYDERASIEGGFIPFYVQAPGASVTIQGLRFIRPTWAATLVNAAHGVMVPDCVGQRDREQGQANRA
jgi:hypothetical protein